MERCPGRHTYGEKICGALLECKVSHAPMERSLAKQGVELLPPSSQRAGGEGERNDKNKAIELENN